MNIWAGNADIKLLNGICICLHSGLICSIFIVVNLLYTL